MRTEGLEDALVGNNLKTAKKTPKIFRVSREKRGSDRRTKRKGGGEWEENRSGERVDRRMNGWMNER